MESYLKTNSSNVPEISMQYLENINNDHVMNTNKNQCSKELVQFCNRFSDDNESNSDQSNDDEISAYYPQTSWEISDYVVCIDGVGVLTNKALSNLPKKQFIVIDTHMMIQKALIVIKSQFELTICEAVADKTWKHNGFTLNKNMFYL